MTTNHDTVTRLTGDLIADFIDRVEDDRVIEATKTFVHEVLDNGSPEDQPYGPAERRVWDLVRALGFAPTSNVWTVEQAIFQVIDEYDLFND